MKNLIKIIAIAGVFILGIQNTTAQSLTKQERPEVVAKQKTAELHEALSLTGDQQRYIFRALTSNEVNYRKNVIGKDAKNPEVSANKKKYDAALLKAMKKTLTAEQFSKWQGMQK